jgi:hypothetical protein
VRVYVGQTRAKELIDRLTSWGIGECTARGELPPRRRPWFYDNGAFGDWTAGRPFNAARFMGDVRRIREEQLAPDFMVVPDRVAAGWASLTESVSWLPVVEGVAPLYLAVQDGMTPEGFDQDAEILERFQGIFVGGSLPWKLQTGFSWVSFAHERGLPLHVGRVGTPDRVEWAKEIGADSIDSCLPLWSEDNLQRFMVAVERDDTKQGRLW